MAFKPTKQQQNAIDAPHTDNAVVTAAAGSGKTTLLVDRILRLISDPELDIPADTLAIMTFTRNAAAALRTKLNSKLAERIRSFPKNDSTRKYLSDQAIALRAAPIGTIDSFCISILKENVHAFRLPMNFTIADDARVNSMKNLAMKSTLAYFYKNKEGVSCPEEEISAEERRILFFTFSFEDDSTLQKNLNAVYDKFTSYADREEWLDRCVGLFEDVNSMIETFAPSILGMIRKHLDKAALQISLMKSIITEYIDEKVSCPNKNQDKVIAAMNSYVSDCDTLLSDTENEFVKLSAAPTAANFTEFFNKINNKETAKFDNRMDAQSPAKKRFTPARNGFTLKSDLQNIEFNESEESLIFPQQKTAVGAFVKLLRRFSEDYRTIMHTSGALDFAECEYLLLERLREDKALRSQLSERYSCIIVDEFQDSNDIQAEIFRLISNGKKNLFYVGDVKQSIYGFRGGNPLIMGRLINKPSVLGRLCVSSGKLTVAPAEECKARIKAKAALKGRNLSEGKFTVLPLTKNFRSRKAVVDTVNALFSGVMTQKYGGIDYANGAALALGSDAFYQPVSDPDKYKTEIVMVDFPNKRKSSDDDDITNTRAQAAVIADKINTLIKEKFLVTEKDGSLRPCGYGDFAILFRKNGHMAVYKEVLALNKVPSVMPKNTEFLAADEINLTRDLLRVIDNPMCDEALLRVLMSPLFGFTADETAQLKLGTLGFPLENIKDDLSPIAKMMKGRTLYGCLSFCCREEDPEYDKNFDPETATDAQKLLNKLSKDEKTKRRINEKAQSFLKLLDKLRNFMSNNPVDELIRFTCDETEIYNVIATYENSRQRLANVRLLQKYATDFERADGGSLSDFLRFLDSLTNKALNAANVPEDVSNAVKLMTFHASKGLEMPICILAELNESIYNRDNSKPILLNHKYGLAMNYVDPDLRYSTDPLAYTTFSRIIKENAFSDELRLLYVATTRPMDKLIITSSASDALWGLKMPKNATPVNVFIDGKPINWILRSLFRNVNADTLYDFDADRSGTLAIGDYAELSVIKLAPANESTSAADGQKSDGDTADGQNSNGDAADGQNSNGDAADGQNSNGDAAAGENTEAAAAKDDKTETEENEEANENRAEIEALAKNIIENLNVEYPHATETRLQAKYAVTELAHSSQDSTTDKIVYFNPPSFAKNGKMTGSKVGDAYHHFMEHCNLEEIRDSVNLHATISDMISRLCGEELITEDERDILLGSNGFDANIVLFFKSELGKRMLSDINKVRREQPFRAEIAANKLGVKGKNGAESSELISIQGRTDMYFYEDDGIVLVDYKSDSQENLEKELKNYCKQLMTYKEILPEVTGVPVKQVLIYSFSLHQVIDCENPTETFKNSKGDSDEN